MICILISRKDKASLNIGDRLLDKWKWDKICERSYRYEDDILSIVDDEHLYHDNIDLEIEKKLDVKFDAVIFASRHKSKSGLKSLSVHPVGNYGKAEHGGRGKKIVSASPHLMTTALRILRDKVKNLDYHACFEVTHHGPWLKTPCFFIEIGSDENAWLDKNAGKVIANTIMETLKKYQKYPIAIGVGGGHYAPRFTDVALSKKVSFAHMIPRYQIENVDEPIIEEIIQKSKPAFVYFHRKGLRKSDYRRLKNVFESKGVKAVREMDLEDIK